MTMFGAPVYSQVRFHQMDFVEVARLTRKATDLGLRRFAMLDRRGCQSLLWTC
jgi:hypothetical protein